MNKEVNDSVCYDDGIETNLYSIAEEICSAPPKPPLSIQLVLGHDVKSDEVDSIEFKLITTFSMACMKVLFGKDSTPNDLSEKDFEKLQKYVNSVGYTLVVDKQESDVDITFKISIQRYKCF
jgi:hypothetical protein